MKFIERCRNRNSIETVYKVHVAYYLTIGETPAIAILTGFYCDEIVTHFHIMVFLEFLGSYKSHKVDYRELTF